MLATLKPLSLFKEGLRNRISISSLVWRLQVLKTNNYPEVWKLSIPNAGSGSRESNDAVNEKIIYASVPCIKGYSERLQKAFEGSEDHNGILHLLNFFNEALSTEIIFYVLKYYCS